MSLLINVEKCPSCNETTPSGRVRPERPRMCKRCINKTKYQKRKLLLKLARLKGKKCHTCGGSIKRLGVFCSEYCRWIGSLRHRHNKIILRVNDV